MEASHQTSNAGFETTAKHSTSISFGRRIKYMWHLHYYKSNYSDNKLSRCFIDLMPKVQIFGNIYDWHDANTSKDY